MKAAPGTAYVRVSRTIGGQVHVSGVRRCASLCCTVCGPTIREGRGVEVDSGLQRAVGQGLSVVMVTATVGHGLGDHLGDVFDLVQGSWSDTWSGRAVQRWKAASGYVGAIRVVEQTYGGSGWHPHVHAVLLFESSPEAALSAAGNLGTRYGAMVGKRGGRVLVGGVSSPGWFCEVVEDVSAVGKYLAGSTETKSWSMGRELSRGDLKTARLGGLAPFEILQLAVTGDSWAAKLWHEYEAAMFNRRVMVWSAGLKARLLVEERTDDELADVEAVEAVEAEWFVPVAQWLWWVRSGLLGIKLQWFDTEPCGASNRPRDGTAAGCAA